MRPQLRIRGWSTVDGTDSGSNGSGNGLSDALGSLLGNYGSTTGQIAPASGSDEVYKPHEPDKTVASVAREKYSDVAKAQSVTVMVYMCGTDLESKSGMATSDLEEMVNATIGSNINVILETGGASNWQNQIIKSNTNQRYRIKQGGLETLNAKVGKRSMVDPDTLADFIQFSAKEYPADRYMLILWDHGGGSLTAFGYDELFPGDSMSLDEINQALKDGGVKFDIIGFDACLMATLETALVTEQYSDYLVASEAVEPGTGWYYTNWLSALSSNPAMDSLDLGKQIIDDYVKMSGNSQTTLSMTDLAELHGTVPAAFKAFSSSTSELIAGDGYNSVANARSGSRDFSTSSKINQIDLIHFAENLATPEATALAQTLRDAVKYNRNSTRPHANGLSIYFPYQSMRSVSTGRLKPITPSDWTSYSECIKSFASVVMADRLQAVRVRTRSALFLATTPVVCWVLCTGDLPLAAMSQADPRTPSRSCSIFLSNRSVVTGDKDSSWVDEDLVKAVRLPTIRQQHGLCEHDDHPQGRYADAGAHRGTMEHGYAGTNVYVDDGSGYDRPCFDNVADYDSDNDLTGWRRRRHVDVSQRADRCVLPSSAKIRWTTAIRP
ncbi:MAG: clostripain-related cysteine peptidase [Eubacteriales bacterium]